MHSIQPHAWHRLTLAAVAALGIALSAVLAVLSGRATLNYESGWFKYELEAPVERVVEQESNAAVIVKVVVPLRIVCGHSGAVELGA